MPSGRTLIHNASIHLVQVGLDDAVFSGTSEEPRKRQADYGRRLNALAPGSRVTLLVLTSNPVARRFSLQNVTFDPVCVDRRAASRLEAWMALGRRLATLHRADPIDVLTTQNVHDEAWVALGFGRCHGIPVVGQIHYDLFSPEAQADLSRSPLLRNVRLALTRRVLPQFSAVRVVGRRTARELHRESLHSNVHVLPVAVAMQQAAHAPEVATLRRAPVVLFVGRLCAQKNLGLWLRVARNVARQVPEVRFEIVGDGPLREPLALEARELGLDAVIRFRGHVAYEDLPPLYQQAGVFLLTSRYEGFGRVLVEAFAHQLPVVATRITGVEDIVKDGVSGFLHASNDVDGLAASVVHLLRDPELARRMGEEGQRFVQSEFDPSHLAEAWIQLLVETARSADGRPSFR